MIFYYTQPWNEENIADGKLRSWKDLDAFGYFCELPIERNT